MIYSNYKEATSLYMEKWKGSEEQKIMGQQK